MNQLTATSSDYTHIIQLNVFPLIIDWMLITDDIKNSGLSYSEQAVALGKESSTLREWRQGAHPRFSDGQALLILHAKICGITLTERRIREFKTET